MKQLSSIRKDALTELQQWSKEDFEAMQLAIKDVYKASIIARQKGLLALEEFETESEFFKWSISMIIDGTDPEYFEELLENKYFIGQFSGIEKCIYYLYARGSLLIQYGINDRLLEEFLISIIPMSYRDNVYRCIELCKEETKNTSYQEAEKRAKEFFKNQDISVLSPEEQQIKYQFDTIFQNMPDRSIQRVLREVETYVLEAAVLYADEITRVRIRTNLSHRLYQCIVEDWESMFNDYKQSIESMKTMLEVCKKLQNNGEIIVPECESSKIDVSIYSKKELKECKELSENTIHSNFYDPLNSGNSIKKMEKNQRNFNFYGWKTADKVKAKNDFNTGIHTPLDLYQVLSHIWCADTCAPRMRNEWTEENKTLGQCSITAFLAQDIFGGDVYGLKTKNGSIHCYNVVDGYIFDLTSEQFKEEAKDLVYEGNEIQHRDCAMHFQKEEKKLRYEYLKKELQNFTFKE